MERISIKEARTLALAAQGFGQRRRARVTPADFRRVIDHIGLVQLDSVNVLERSHYLPFFARLGPYDRAALHRHLFEEGHVFEQWGHCAAVIPIEQFAMLRHRWESRRKDTTRLFDEASIAYADSVLAEGPIRVAALEDRGERSGQWWGYSKGKAALDWHFHTGTLATTRTPNFNRVYELPERLYLAEVLAEPALPEAEAHRQMLTIAAKCHGIGTLRDLADYFRVNVTKARPRLNELLDAGTLVPVQVEGWAETAYALAGVALPARRMHARALLSPFDSLVWDRARNVRLFDFHYRIEIYTPQPKRIFGYYVMPFLLGAELVGRVDMKADRQSNTLRAQAIWLEPGRTDAARVAPEVLAELRLMAGWLGLERVHIEPRGNLADAVLAATEQVAETEGT